MVHVSKLLVATTAEGTVFLTVTPGNAVAVSKQCQCPVQHRDGAAHCKVCGRVSGAGVLRSAEHPACVPKLFYKSTTLSAF